jgi:Ca2+:H+ antiporter
LRIEYLLVFVPVAVALNWLASHWRVAAFAAAAAGIAPLAAQLGRTIEQLAEKNRSGDWNVTFGNAAEMIIGLTALRSGLGDVVKASITGAVIGNLRLVLGAALLAGGLHHPVQTFNATAARSRTTMLLLAATALIAPAVYHHLAGRIAVRARTASALRSQSSSSFPTRWVWFSRCGRIANCSPATPPKLGHRKGMVIQRPAIGGNWRFWPSLRCSSHG